MAEKPTPPDPKRRWWQFRLRTVLVALVMLPISCGWTAYQLNWLRERHEILPDADAPSGRTLMHGVALCNNADVAAPWPLRLFGEAGCYALYTCFDESSPEVAKLRRLFPEASIHCNPPCEE